MEGVRRRGRGEGKERREGRREGGKRGGEEEETGLQVPTPNNLVWVRINTF